MAVFLEVPTAVVVCELLPEDDGSELGFTDSPATLVVEDMFPEPIRPIGWSSSSAWCEDRLRRIPTSASRSASRRLSPAMEWANDIAENRHR